MLKSIDLNHKTDERIEFHIIDDGISAKVIKQLDSIADPLRIPIKMEILLKIISVKK